MSPSDLLPVYPITGYDCDEISLKIFMITLFLLKIISNVQDASYFEYILHKNNIFNCKMKDNKS